MNPLLPFALLALASCSDPCAESIDQAFLDREAAKEGAVRTESGLIYQELKGGYGPQPGAKDPRHRPLQGHVCRRRGL